MEQTIVAKGPEMSRVLLALFAAIVLLFPHPAVAAIPEPPPYPWEYLPPGAVAFIPWVEQSALVPPDQLQPGW